MKAIIATFALALAFASTTSIASACEVKFEEAYAMEFKWSTEEVMVFSPVLDGDFVEGYVCSEDGSKLLIKELSSDVRMVKVEF